MCSEFYFVLPFSALPFHCFTSQFSVSPSLRLSEPVRFIARSSCHFFAFAILCTAERFYAVSILRSSTPCLGVSAGIVLHLSIPFPLRSQRFRISRCYSHPCHSFSPQSCSVLFCCFACPIKSISDQRISVSFRIYSSQFSSVSVHFYTKHVLSQRLCCNATLIASRPSHIRATPLLFKSFWIISLPLLVQSLHFHAIANHIQSVLFHLGATPCHSISPRGRAIPYHISALPCCAIAYLSPPCCAIAYRIDACPIRFAAYLRSSFAALFTIQGVLMPYLLSAF